MLSYKMDGFKTNNRDPRLEFSTNDLALDTARNILSIESKLKSLQHKSFSTSEGEAVSLSALNSKGQLDNVYTRRLVRKLKMKRDLKNSGLSTFDLDKSFIKYLIEETSKRKLSEFHSKKTLSNYVSNIGDITATPIQIPKKIRKVKEVKPGTKKTSPNSIEKSLKPKPQEKPMQSEPVKHRKNSDCVSSADMETHLIRTLNKGEKSYTGRLHTYNELYQSVEERIMGDVYNKRFTTLIKSPWSGKSLKPIIRQDFESKPLKMRLLEDIIAFPHRRNKAWVSDTLNPINYLYLRPYMVESVNNLLKATFWPEIDISESLLYPEHTIIVLYKEYVIGCGFITPSGYITYFCVHPEWGNAGIGKFMLYHLIQTCPGRDITLHVSVNNPAMILYQKFSFKIEEFIRNFYDKYLPEDSKNYKHAFFLRLRR